MIYKRWQLAAIIIAVLIGVLSALPNVLPPQMLRFIPFSQQIYLGLDLKGGTYLQLQVDIPAAEKERSQATLDQIRAALRTARIQYSDLRLAGDSIALRINDPTKVADARRVLQPITGVGLAPDYAVT